MNDSYLKKALKDPLFYLVDFNFRRQLILFAHAKPKDFSKSLLIRAEDFPIDRMEWVSFDRIFDLVDCKDKLPSLNYIFHLPFCGSSLFTKYFEKSAFVLRDPVSLFSLYLPDPNGEKFPDSITKLRNVTFNLLSRKYGNKPTVIRTGGSFPEMMGPIVRSNTFCSAIFMYSSPRFYLAQVLKSTERRSNLRHNIFPNRRILKKLGLPKMELMSDAQIAAASWIIQMESILPILRSGKKICTLNGEVFLRKRLQSFYSASDFLGLPRLQSIGTQFSKLDIKHVKTGKAVTEAERTSELNKCFKIYQDEIQSGLDLLFQIDPFGKYQKELSKFQLLE